MLALRITADTRVLPSSLSGSSASAMSSEEKGPSRVAALGFRTFCFLAAPINGDLFVGRGAVLPAITGLIGVAGASWGTEALGWLKGGATDARFPTLRIAGSAKGCAVCLGVATVDST